MNVREKFIWDALLVITVIIVIIMGYFLYKINVEKTAYVETYEIETIGTDLTLTQNIKTLEQNFVERQNYRFKVKEIPTDLARVIIFDSGELRGYGGNKVRFSAGVAGKNAHAVAHYKDQILHVTVGDSVAGGVVRGITATEVSFFKDDELIKYSLIPEISSEKLNR